MRLGQRLYEVFVRWPRAAIWIGAVVVVFVLFKVWGIP